MYVIKWKCSGDDWVYADTFDAGVYSLDKAKRYESVLSAWRAITSWVAEGDCRNTQWKVVKIKTKPKVDERAAILKFMQDHLADWDHGTQYSSGYLDCLEGLINDIGKGFHLE